MPVPPKKTHIHKINPAVIKYLAIRTLGNFLILFTIFGVTATFGPALYFESRYQLTQFFDIKYEVVKETPTSPSEFTKILQKGQKIKRQPNLFDEVLNGDQEEILYPEDPSFTVMIPKIGANERVTPNVDPNNEKEYLEVLSRTIAHAKGTSFPGLDGTTYLFAHSTDNFWSVGRYNAVFYLLNKMEIGDEVVLFFNGKRYNYTVSETKIVDSTDTHYIDSAMGQGERVILQTCWPPGTAWKRLLVFATPKK
jgi:LPXTG-site transpeptidase (sortase) family protein